jgi:hypothetical protein
LSAGQSIDLYRLLLKLDDVTTGNPMTGEQREALEVGISQLEGEQK